MTKSTYFSDIHGNTGALGLILTDAEKAGG